MTNSDLELESHAASEQVRDQGVRGPTETPPSAGAAPEGATDRGWTLPAAVGWILAHDPCAVAQLCDPIPVMNDRGEARGAVILRRRNLLWELARRALALNPGAKDDDPSSMQKALSYLEFRENVLPRLLNEDKQIGEKIETAFGEALEALAAGELQAYGDRGNGPEPLYTSGILRTVYMAGVLREPGRRVREREDRSRSGAAALAPPARSSPERTGRVGGQRSPESRVRGR